MNQSSTMTSLSSSELKSSLDLFEVKPGLKFSLGTLKDLLPDVETLLFFGKVYELDAQQLGALLHKVLNTRLTAALFAESNSHSTDLQDYLVGEWDEDDECWYGGVVSDLVTGTECFSPTVPKGEILPEVWAQLEVEVASSIKAVAEKLTDVVALMPGKVGEMHFKSMMALNARRPVLGDFRAQIVHARQQRNLVILDVSGSMNERTVESIVEDVVAMSYNANADFAVVSDRCTFWEAGTYDVAAILAAATYGGTHYEELAPLFDRDWGTVITVADYDSSPDAKRVLSSCVGRVDQVLDISLVNRPTFMAECVGQLAAAVRPLLIATTSYVLA